MAVAVTGDQTHASDSGGVISLTWAMTMPVGGDCIIVCVGAGDSGGAEAVASVTYNSDALAQIGSYFSGDGTWVSQDAWFLVAPDVGASQNIVITYDTGPDQAGGIGIPLSGVHQTTPLGTAANNNGSGTTASVGVGSASGDLVVFSLMSDDEGGPSEGGTLIRETDVIADDTWLSAQSYAGTGSTVTGSWTQADEGWACGGVAIKPAEGGGGGGIAIPVVYHHRQRN